MPKFVLEMDLKVHPDRLDPQDQQVNPVMLENRETLENQAAMESQETLEARDHQDPQVDQVQLETKALMHNRHPEPRDPQGKCALDGYHTFKNSSHFLKIYSYFMVIT